MGGNHVLARLRNAAAQGRLVVITGAGISSRLMRPNGTRIPNWEKLVEELWSSADESRLSKADRRLLAELMPSAERDKLHGDALIEASEILRGGFDEGDFEKTIARLCREKRGETSDTHRAIVSIAPAGIITFNYDRAQETAFRERGVRFEPILYSADARIKARLARRRSGAPFLLKAHGCVSDPASLVLTSSSYREVLSRCRAYRLFLQYVLVHFTVLIVGFALRDRDFDQLLGTLEIELGKPKHQHVFIAGRPAPSPEGKVQQAAWAALTARFGVDPLYVRDFGRLPALIRSLAEKPGPLIRNLVGRAQSTDKHVREAAHDEMEMLGEVGRRQVRAALLAAIDEVAAEPGRRSELIYALRGVGDGEPEVAARLVAEIVRAVNDFASARDLVHTECAAHALLVLRRSRLRDTAQRNGLLRDLAAPKVQKGLEAMDRFVEGAGEVPRLVAYARAACAEIEARARV
jgi:hypothetical protein